MCSTCAQAYSPLGKGTRQVLEDRTVSSVAQRRGRTNAQVPIAAQCLVSCGHSSADLQDHAEMHHAHDMLMPIMWGLACLVFLGFAELRIPLQYFSQGEKSSQLQLQ